MRAYHGDVSLKEKYLKRVRAHRAADELIKGATQGRMAGGKFKGCAVVCTLERYDHAGYEAELGIPRILARLEDGIFENLPDERSMSWPEEFLEAIPTGADLSAVWDRFAHWLLVNENYGVIRFAKTERTKKAIQQVADLYERKIKGETIERAEWKKAAAYADAAYADAAYAYAYAAYASAYAASASAAAAYAASASADAASAAAASASAAAASAAAAYASAAAAARVRQADKLLELLRTAPILEIA